MTDVSIVLPTFNEAGNLKLLIPDLVQQLESHYDFEILVVDDMSLDGTQSIVSQMTLLNPRIRLIERLDERGLASALHRGVLEAKGRSIILMDADTTHHASNVPILLHVHSAFDIVSASRFTSGGAMQGRVRYLGSYLFNLWIRAVLRTQIQDNLAGFFVIRRDLLMSLPLHYIFRGYGDYFLRLLYLARRRGFTIVEIPTVYTVRPYGLSKSRLMKMAFTYTGAALGVRMKAKSLDNVGNHLTGR